MRNVAIRAHLVEQVVEEWGLGLAGSIDEAARAAEVSRRRVQASTLTMRLLRKRVVRAQERITTLARSSDEVYRATVEQIEADGAEAAGPLA